MLSTESRAPQASSRLAGTAGTLLLQALFIAAFLHSSPKFGAPVWLGRELTLTLPRLPQAQTMSPPGAASPSARTSVPAKAPQAVAPAVVPSTPVASIPDIRNFGRALNDCAPEQYASLPPEQQARCPRPGGSAAIPHEPNLMGGPSHVKDEAHWQAELARKKSPFALACYGGTDLLCLIETIGNGSITDPRTWPIYETKQYAPEDFYKIEQAYDEWHKAHPQ